MVAVVQVKKETEQMWLQTIYNPEEDIRDTGMMNPSRAV